MYNSALHFTLIECCESYTYYTIEGPSQIYITHTRLCSRDIFLIGVYNIRIVLKTRISFKLQKVCRREMTVIKKMEKRRTMTGTRCLMMMVNVWTPLPWMRFVSLWYLSSFWVTVPYQNLEHRIVFPKFTCSCYLHIFSVSL